MQRQFGRVKQTVCHVSDEYVVRKTNNKEQITQATPANWTGTFHNVKSTQTKALKSNNRTAADDE